MDGQNTALSYTITRPMEIHHCPQTDTENDHYILRKELEAALQSLKKVKSAGVDKIAAELVQVGG